MIPIQLESTTASALAKDLANRAPRGHRYYFAGPIEGRRVQVELEGFNVDRFTINDIEFGPASFTRKCDLKQFVMRVLT